MGYLIVGLIGLLVGCFFGVRAGFRHADDNWVKHLEKHGWDVSRDPADPDSLRVPRQKYGDHWYEQRREDP